LLLKSKKIVYRSTWWIQSYKIPKINQGMNKIPWPLSAIYCLEVKGVSVWFKHVGTIFFWNLRSFCIALLFLHFKQVLKIFRWHTHSKIIMLIIQNQSFKKNQAFFVVPLRPMIDQWWNHIVNYWRQMGWRNCAYDKVCIPKFDSS